ncbi:MAG TPA: metallophosphoesterase [Actinopolymorphaceae bacterium]
MTRSNRLRRLLSVVLGAACTALLTTGSAMGDVVAPKPATDTTFTIAVIPDTQNEVVYRLEDEWFKQRTQWLVDNADALNLKFVTHTGDVVNWYRIDNETVTYDQYIRASDALAVLDNAGIPYSLSIGNHDAAATCEGGAACPGEDTHANLRNTEVFNSFFPPSRFANLVRVYERNKIDNSYHTFTAGGLQWLVLNLELWPRKEVVNWAKGVVAGHPHHNVIIVTHSHLTASGDIAQTNGGYGDTSPQYVFDNLTSRYRNVRFVFSGHTGLHAYRVDSGVHGNTIYQIQSTYHDHASTRLVEIDTANGSFSTRVYSRETGQDHDDGSSFSVSDVEWVQAPPACKPSKNGCRDRHLVAR